MGGKRNGRGGKRATDLILGDGGPRKEHRWPIFSREEREEVNGSVIMRRVKGRRDGSGKFLKGQLIGVVGEAGRAYM